MIARVNESDRAHVITGTLLNSSGQFEQLRGASSHSASKPQEMESHCDQ